MTVSVGTCMYNRCPQKTFERKRKGGRVCAFYFIYDLCIQSMQVKPFFGVITVSFNLAIERK